MDALIFAQTVFYLTASLAIIVLGFLGAVAIYYLIQLVQNLNKFSGDLDLTLRELKNDFQNNLAALSSNLNQSSEEIKKKVKYLIERISNFPLLSYFLKQSANKKSTKSKRSHQ